MDDVSAAARAISARRKRSTKVCEACGKSFEGLAWSRYCSPPCKHRGWINENRERYAAARQARAISAERSDRFEPARPANRRLHRNGHYTIMAFIDACEFAQ